MSDILLAHGLTPSTSQARLRESERERERERESLLGFIHNGGSRGVGHPLRLVERDPLLSMQLPSSHAAPLYCYRCSSPVPCRSRALSLSRSLSLTLFLPLSVSPSLPRFSPDCRSSFVQPSRRGGVERVMVDPDSVGTRRALLPCLSGD